ncbi:right-handed parallel beta-helix repeat-containing protein [Rariglobus hedericola]|uniref:Right-handed parallel beta-helix repeat-containing protein n=1 Tax=Rariglobus hedericola TaxID=2597822 RepID=A0A556QJK3_9BACT|nr:right-handed parallel beta-helix repeat-containing protein [Rariglobus hedericola]TSJ76797.1 right-handed parallel beta-helix repeat-containing protein [Rariglobus hedericola]
MTPASGMPKILGLFIAALIVLCSSARADFTWTPTSLYNGTHPPYTPGAWTTDWVPGPNGTGQSIKVTIASGATYYNFVVIPRSYLNPGVTQFRAVLSFRIATPAVMPRYFYMFARCSGVSGQPEYWQRFTADPADGARTIEFPVDLKPVAGGTWNLYLGCYGTGSIIIDSLVIKDGWGLTTQQPAVNATPASILPPNVTEATGSPTITITPPASGTVTTFTATTLVADGATPVSSATAAANSSALQALLTTAKNTAGTKKILIPPGTYRFESAAQINIQDTNDLTIDGQGADFIFQRLYTGPHFSVSKCNRTVIKNLNLDWNWDYKRIASLGKVLSLSADKKTAVFEFAGQTAAQTLLTRGALWHSLSPMDPVKLFRDRPEFFLLKDTPPTSLVASGNQITATFVNPLSLDVNRSYLIKHLYYEMIAFKIAGSTHLVFDTVNIYSVPGMGWLNTEASHHLKWFNCKMARRTGSTYPLVSGADGIHSAESQGDIIIQNCVFTGLGDDAINLHDNCWQGGLDYAANANQLILRNCPRNKLRIQSGDVLRFSNADYSPTGLELTVSGTPVYTAPAGGNVDSPTAYATVTFTTAVPTGLSRLLIANNTRFQTKNVRITGTQFTWTNGRGILLSANDATIESCYFRNVSATSIQITTEIVDTAFMEGRGASNIVVRNNTFENTGQTARFGGSVIHVGAIIPWGPADYFMFDTLLFDGNRFFNAPGPAMSFISGINVIVRNSRIELTQSMFNQTPFSGTLQAELSADLALGGNTWKNFLAAPYVSGVVYNPDLTTNLEYQTNRMENY